MSFCLHIYICVNVSWPKSLLANLPKAISYRAFKWYLETEVCFTLLYRLLCLSDTFMVQPPTEVCFSWLVNHSNTVKTLAIVAKPNFALVFEKCAVCSFKLCCSWSFEHFQGKMLFLLIIVPQFEDLERPVATLS